MDTLKYIAWACIVIGGIMLCWGLWRYMDELDQARRIGRERAEAWTRKLNAWREEHER